MFLYQFINTACFRYIAFCLILTRFPAETNSKTFKLISNISTLITIVYLIRLFILLLEIHPIKPKNSSQPHPFNVNLINFKFHHRQIPR